MSVIGLDLGTSSCKTVLVNASGKTIKFAVAHYPLKTPKPLWSEQDPEDWWQAVISTVHEILSSAPNEKIQGIGLSGQMFGLILLDKQDQILRPAILWNDGRASEQCNFLHKKIPNLRQETGNAALVGLAAPKILWVQENEPELWAKVDKILLPKDYLRYRLTGHHGTDMSDGSGALLMNVAKRAWSPLMLETCHLQEKMLGELREGDEISGYLTPTSATHLGLDSGIPVVTGTGDQSAGALGVGCIQEGQTMISMGTSGIILTTTENYKSNVPVALHNFCHGIPNKWLQMGVVLSGAGSLQWYRDTCAENMPFDELCSKAKEAPRGSEDLIFLPYLTGERTPHCDPYVRGAFIGLSRQHTQAHLVRAVFEGIGMGLYETLQLIRETGIEIKEGTLIGTAAQSSEWMQILANILNIKLIQNENIDVASALGAARLALIGCLNVPVEKACSANRLLRCFTPETEASRFYQKRITRFQSLYPLLKEYYHQPERALACA